MKRLIWIVNHKTLLMAEVPIMRSIGWEVFVPKVFPDDPGYRSAAATNEFDDALELAPLELAILNSHNFYSRDWSTTLTSIINENFQAIIATWSAYIHPLSESARKFDGKLLARVFGREQPVTYAGVTKHTIRPNLLDELGAMGSRFTFAQAFDNLGEVEPSVLRDRALTITTPLPDWMFAYANTWRGDGDKAVFLGPAANDGGYYQNIYERIKYNFGDIPHVIFGRQYKPIDDPHILQYMSDLELMKLYASTPVFAYPHTEPRHLHYSPLEAMLVGTPVLYLKGTELDAVNGHRAVDGACDSLDEMKQKAMRLLSGDRVLAESIRYEQSRVLHAISKGVASEQWRAALG